MNTEVIRAEIPEELKNEFEAAAAARGWTLSHAIKQLMMDYVSHEKDWDRRNKETIVALEAVEAGHTVDGDKVMEWLASWGTENEKAPPK